MSKWGYCNKEFLVWIWFKSQNSFKQNKQIFLFTVLKKNKQVICLGSDIS